jgi:hypothetical protein
MEAERMREVNLMSRLRVSGLITAVLLAALALSAAQGYVVILKSGHKLRCKEPMRIEGPNAIITLSTGTMTSYPLKLVDLVETERYNQLGLGDALLIETVEGDGAPLPTPTPRVSLGERTSIDAGGVAGPSLGVVLEPTPVPTPGIKLRTVQYHDERVVEAFSKIFDDKNLLIYKTSQGTQPEYLYVQTNTDSEREVFAALETVAEAYVLIHSLHNEIAPEAVELEMIQTSGKPAGTFRLTPVLADELVNGDIAIQAFYINNVIF